MLALIFETAIPANPADPRLAGRLLHGLEHRCQRCRQRRRPPRRSHLDRPRGSRHRQGRCAHLGAGHGYRRHCRRPGTRGYKAIATIGTKITQLTPSRGFAANIGAATTIVVASRPGFPISTTHALVGAVLGVGLARGVQCLNPRVIRDIVLSWIITIPAGALLAVASSYILKGFSGG